MHAVTHSRASTGREPCAALPDEFVAPGQATSPLDPADGLGRSGRRGFDRELTLQGLRNGGFFDMPIQVFARSLAPVPCVVACLASAHAQKALNATLASRKSKGT